MIRAAAGLLTLLALGQIDVLDEGAFQGRTRSRINCSGSGVSCAGPDGGTMTITVTGGGGSSQLAASGVEGIIGDGGTQTLSPAFTFERPLTLNDYLYVVSPAPIYSGGQFGQTSWGGSFCAAPADHYRFNLGVPNLCGGESLFKLYNSNTNTTFLDWQYGPGMQVYDNAGFAYDVTVTGMLDAGRVIANDEMAIPQMEFANFPSAATSLGRIILDLTSGVFRWSDGTNWLYAVPGSPDGGPLNVYVTGPLSDGGWVESASYLHAWRPNTQEWDKVYLLRNDWDDLLPYSGGMLGTMGFGYVYDSASGEWKRMPGNAQGVKVQGADGGPIEVYSVNGGGGSSVVWVDGGIISLGGFLPDGGYSQVPLAEDRALVVDSHSDAVIHAGNSTTTPLGNGGNFTGTTIDMTDYSTIRVSVFADKASATNGFKIQFSNDGTNWDFTRQTTLSANQGAYPAFNRVARYARVNYTNGNQAQTVFRLQTMLIPQSAEYSRVFTDETPGDSTSAVVTSSMIYGLSSAGGGTYVQVKVDPSGALNTSTTGTVTVNQGTSRDGGTDWPVLARQGPSSDGGLPWVVEARQGLGADGGAAAWNVNGMVAVTNTVAVSGSVTATISGTPSVSGTVTANQGTARDGGVFWPVETGPSRRYQETRSTTDGGIYAYWRLDAGSYIPNLAGGQLTITTSDNNTNDPCYGVWEHPVNMPGSAEILFIERDGSDSPHWGDGWYPTARTYFMSGHTVELVHPPKQFTGLGVYCASKAHNFRLEWTDVESPWNNPSLIPLDKHPYPGKTGWGIPIGQWSSINNYTTAVQGMTAVGGQSVNGGLYTRWYPLTFNDERRLLVSPNAGPPDNFAGSLASSTASRRQEAMFGRTTDAGVLDYQVVTLNGGSVTYADGLLLSTSTASSEIKIASKEWTQLRSGTTYVAEFTMALSNVTSYGNEASYFGVENAAGQQLYFGWPMQNYSSPCFWLEGLMQTPTTSFNVDTLSGDNRTLYTSDGIKATPNFQKSQKYRFIFHADPFAMNMTLQIWSPDGVWVTAHRQIITATNYNTIFREQKVRLFAYLRNGNTGQVRSMYAHSWSLASYDNGDTRLDEELSDRSYAKVSRSILTGRHADGGYANIALSSAGALPVSQADEIVTCTFDEQTDTCTLDTTHGYQSYTVSIDDVPGSDFSQCFVKGYGQSPDYYNDGMPLQGGILYSGWKYWEEGSSYPLSAGDPPMEVWVPQEVTRIVFSCANWTTGSSTVTMRASMTPRTWAPGVTHWSANTTPDEGILVATAGIDRTTGSYGGNPQPLKGSSAGGLLVDAQMHRKSVTTVLGVGNPVYVNAPVSDSTSGASLIVGPYPPPNAPVATCEMVTYENRSVKVYTHPEDGGTSRMLIGPQSIDAFSYYNSVEVPPGATGLRLDCGYVRGEWDAGIANVVLATGFIPTEVPQSVTPIMEPVAGASNPGGCTSVSTASVTVLASYAARKHSSVCADSDNTKKVYIRLGLDAGTSGFPLAAGQCMSPDNGTSVYTGPVDAIAQSGTQSVCAWEF